MTQLVGILNITPDSFSDGGHYDAPQAAYAHAETLLSDGATILDIGAESTRPGATPLTPQQEWKRLQPCLQAIVTLAHQQGATVSLDTRHTSTAQRGLACGIDWINDVSGGQDATMLKLVAEAGCDYVLMHSLSVPAAASRQLPTSVNVVSELDNFFHQTLNMLQEIGINKERTILDPGIGFGKSAAHSLQLLWNMPRFTRHGCRLLAGHSRKSCFALASPDKSHRDALTLLASSFLMQYGVNYLRVHDVRAHATLQHSLAI